MMQSGVPGMAGGEKAAAIDYDQALIGATGAPILREGAQSADGVPTPIPVTLLHACNLVLFAQKDGETPELRQILRRGRIVDAMHAGEPLSSEEIGIIMERLDLLVPELAYAVAKILDPAAVAKA